MAQRELIRETEWSREYRVGPQTVSFESKFLKDGLEITADIIRERWPGWTLEQQIDFANAFILKPRLTEQDQLILGYLLEAGSEIIHDTVAHLLPRYSDPEQALATVLDRVESPGRCVGNWYQSLESMGDARALPALRRRYERYRRELPPLDQLGIHSELADYQHCCRALWKLDGSPEYEHALEELLLHPDPGIRRCSFYLLHDRWPEPD